MCVHSLEASLLECQNRKKIIYKVIIFRVSKQMWTISCAFVIFLLFWECLFSAAREVQQFWEWWVDFFVHPPRRRRRRHRRHISCCRFRRVTNEISGKLKQKQAHISSVLITDYLGSFFYTLNIFHSDTWCWKGGVWWNSVTC